MRIRTFCAAAVVAAFTMGSAVAQTPAIPVVGNSAAPVIPVEKMFRKAEFGNIALSPDGKLLGALAPRGGRFNLAVLNIEKSTIARITNITETDVNTFFWIGNDRLVFSTADRQGFETRGDGGIYAIDANGQNGRELSKPIRSKLADGNRVIRNVTPIGRVRGSADEIYITSNERSLDSNDVFKLNTRTGKKTLITFDSPGKVRRWVFDNNQIARAAVSSDDKTMKAWFSYRENENSPWQKMYEWDLLADEVTPQFFDKNDKLYVASNLGRNTMALFEYDIAGRKLGKLVYGDDTYDLVPPTVWNFGGSRVGVRFGNEDLDDQIIGISYNADKPKTVWFDEKYATLQAQLDKTLAGATNSFGVMKDRMLVTSRSDRDPGTVFMFDRIKPSITEVIRFRDWINPKEMAEMQPIKFAASDGVEIHGYLTLPVGFQKGKPVPMILHPHGGPWARDGWGYNSEVQMMANRGYAVLQVNFRNSLGYGSKILRGGYKEWGGRAQKDMYEGVMWAVREGYADKDKLATYGASYGGYSALMQVAMYPDTYKWAINYVGVTDMFVHQDTQPAQRFGGFDELAKRTNGDAKIDREMFDRTSPTLLVSKIKVPVLHAYGGEDQNVNIANGTAIRRAFEKAGLPVNYIFVQDEAHGYREDKNVFMFYKGFEDFAEKSIRTGRVTIGDLVEKK
jgi:dipeptidyl aminopeptidase/acylaminoacyl peptidase